MGGYRNAGDFTVREYGVANYLTIKRDSGNVGIGTTSPIAHLDVRGGAVALTPGGGLDPNVYHTWFPYFDNNNYIRGTTIIADQGATSASAQLVLNTSLT